MGGGENMFNAGVSFKFGSGNEYSNYSKASLAAVVSEQVSTITALNSRMENRNRKSGITGSSPRNHAPIIGTAIKE